MNKAGGNASGAKTVGTEIAKRAKSKGIETVVYDRGGYNYHGRVKVLAEAAGKQDSSFSPRKTGEAAVVTDSRDVCRRLRSRILQSD